MRLALVVHFIKLREDNRFGEAPFPWRHRRLREIVEEQWRVLASILSDHPDLRRYIVGFDAAANELHSPPEVFAPVFRAIRAAGFGNFTYHAGEDFVHLLTGVRAVWEALEFLELGSGGRIGHATAVGLDPAVWRDRIGREVIVRQGDRLDDLVVAARLMSRIGDVAASSRLQASISTLSQRVYGRVLPADLLYEAWTYRKLDVLTAFGHRGLEVLKPWERAEASAVRIAALNSDAYELFRAYHGQGPLSDAAQRGQTPIMIVVDDNR